MRAAILLAIVAASCARSQDRAESLRAALLAQDREALAADPALVAAKYERMAKSSFAFFRGTAALSPREPSRHLTPAASQIAIIGDPHPENVGVFRAGDGLRLVDFNDFDLAGYGPFVHDLRRLALGLWLISDMADLPRKHRARVVAQTVEGYLAEVDALAAGAPPVALRPDTAFGGDLEELLTDYDDDRGTEGVAASPDEEALARRLLAQYPKTRHGPPLPPQALAPKRVLRQAAGVASYPRLRLRVVVEGPGPGADDDVVIELKESRGTPAARIIAIQRRFQERPDADPYLGWAADGAREFRVREVGPERRRLDVEHIVKLLKSPRWKKRDMRAFAFDLGRLLARGHARAPGADGRPGLAALQEALRDRAGLARETTDVVARQARATEQDLALFRKLLRERGPLLGE